MSNYWRYLTTPLALAVSIDVTANALSAVFPQEIEKTDNIVAAAQAAVTSHPQIAELSNLDIQIKPLDNRLRLPACDKPLTGSLPQDKDLAGSLAVEVSCAGSQQWRLYVRARLEADIQIAALRYPLRRGAQIQAADIYLIQVPLSSLHPGTVRFAGELDGMQLKRNLKADTPISASLLTAPDTVKRGQQVELLLENGPMQIKINAEALGNASTGESVQVKNLSSGRLITGIVGADGKVRVNF